MQQVADGIHRLGTSVHGFYILAEGGKATVVDAGCSREWTKLVSGLAELGLKPEDVEAILITHVHADHFGFAAKAATEGLRVKVHEDDLARAEGRYEGKAAVQMSDLNLFKPATWRFLLPLAIAGATSMDHTTDVETVRDGEVLDLPGSPLVVHTPGHTEGHAAYHLPDRRTTFVGDALATMGLLGGPTGPQLMPDLFHNDPALARESLARLAALDSDLLLPGHGDALAMPIADAVAAV